MKKAIWDGTRLDEKETKVLDFLYFWGRPIKVGELVRHLSLKHSTLNSVLKRLVEKDLIKWAKYGPVQLTNLGNDKGAHFTNHHLIIEKFLKESLNISDEFAHSEALKLANVISCELIEKICEKYKIPEDKMNYSFCEERNYQIR